MANLAVSGTCNLSCDFCFAADHMRATRDRPALPFLSLEAFDDRLDFLDRSGIDEVRLIGGEPTLHPRFDDLVRRAVDRGKEVVVFTHGVMPRRALAALAALPAEACRVVVNMNAHGGAGSDSANISARRLATIRRLGPRVVLGHTIQRVDFDLSELIALVRAHGCRPRIRLGLAHVMLSGGNAFLHPKHYPAVGRRVAAAASAAGAAGIRLELDCGFVRCMFTDDDVAALRRSGTEIGLHCGPILDIDVGGRVIHCFPLAERVGTPLTLADDASALRDALARQVAGYRRAGVYRECQACAFRERGECTGGCLSFTIRRFRSMPGRLRVPAPPRGADPARPGRFD